MQGLLVTHISAGTIALLAAAIAAVSEKGKQVHSSAGKTYFWSMLGIFLTAIPTNSQSYLTLSPRTHTWNWFSEPRTSDWLLK